MVTREEIDAIFNAGTPKTNGVTKADIDAIFDAGSTKQATAPVSSPKPKANADLLAYAERVSQSAKRDAEKAKINEEKAKREKAIATAREKVAQATDSLNKGLSSVITERKPLNPTTIPVVEKAEPQTEIGLLESKQDKEIQQKEAEVKNLESQIASETHKALKRNMETTLRRKQKGLDKAVREKNQIVLNDNSSEDEVERAIDQWNASDYKMTDAERKQARRISTDYLKSVHNKRDWTDAEIAKYRKMATLYSKSNLGSAVMAGIWDALPLSNTLMAGVDKIAGTDAAEYLGAVKENAQTQNPVASGVGNMAGTLGSYMVGSEIMKSIPAVAGVTGKAGGAVGKGAEKGLSAIGFKGAQKAGQAIGQGASNVLGDTMLDVALDTVPNALDDAKSGLSAKEVTTNALKNVGTNLAFNVAGEGLIQGLPKLGKVVGNKKKVVTNLPEIEQLGKDLNPLADARKVDDLDLGAVEQTQKQAVDKIEELSEQIPKMADGVPADKVDEFDGQVQNTTKEHALSIEEQVNEILSDEQAMKSFVEETGISLNGTEKQNREIITLYKEKLTKYSEVESKRQEINSFVDETVANNGQTKEKHNQKRIVKVPKDVAEKVRLASGGTLDISDKYFALEGGKLHHELVTHSDATIEASRGQLPLTVEDAKNLPYVMIDPDIVENISNGLKSEQRQTFALVKKSDGYIVLIEAVGGKRNPNIVPEQILKLSPKKMEKVLNGKLSIADLVFENSKRTGNVAGNAMDIKKRVTAAQLAQSAPVNTSKTYQRSPLFDNSISNPAQNVNPATGEILEEASRRTVNMAESSGLRNPELTVDAKKVGSNVPPATPVGETASDVLGKEKVSKARTNTLENSGINTTDELASEYLDESRFTYREITEKESVQNAVDRISADAKGWYDKLMQADEFTGADVDTMMIMYRKLVNEARATNNNELWEQASAVFKKIQETGTKNGQAIQAFAKWSRNTPEGIVADTFREIKQKATKTLGDKKAQKLVDGLSDDLQKEIYELADEVVKNGKDSRAGQIAYAKIGKIINANTPKSLGGVVKSYLMNSMLLNFRTLISRNFGGNLGYNAMEFARQPITAGIDKAVSLATGTRTRTGWSTDKMKSAVEGLAKGLKDEADDFVKGIHTAKSGQNDLQDVIYANAHPYKGGNVVTKALNKIDDITKHGLSVGDRPFYEAAYKQRMAELTELRQKGLLGEDVAKLSDDEFKEYAELAAKLDGLTATYQDYGAMAKAFDSGKEFIGNLSKGAVGFDALSQLTMPFTRTPGNIITRSLEYSPLGVVKNAVNTGNEIRKGNFNQQRFVDETGRNLLGMGLFGGGVMAYDNGLLTGSYSDDEDMRQAQKNDGMQEYALNTGKGNYDISWLPVLGSDLTAAAAFKEAYDKNADEPLQAVWKGATAGADALLNTSTLQGMNRMFGGNQSYSTEQNLLQNAGSAIASGFGQVIPAQVRQVAQTTDEFERNVSNGDRPYAVNSLISSLPELREAALQPKVDNEGNLVRSNQGRGIGSRILENMISPGKYTELSNSVPNTEAMRLFEETGDKRAFLPTAERDEITTDAFTPTDEQFRVYKQRRGSLNSEMAGALIESTFYQSLSDEQKSEALSSIYEGMKAVAKEESVEGYSSDNKIAAVYKENGVDGVVEYMKAKHTFESVGISTSNKVANEYYNNGSFEEYVEIDRAIKSYGLDTNDESSLEFIEQNGLDEYKRVSDAIESVGVKHNSNNRKLFLSGGIPVLRHVKAADNNNDGSVTKEKELIPYLKKQNWSEEEKNRVVEQFGFSTKGLKW